MRQHLLPPFWDAVHAGVATAMLSYNTPVDTPAVISRTWSRRRVLTAFGCAYRRFLLVLIMSLAKSLIGAFGSSCSVFPTAMHNCIAHCEEQ